MTSPDDRRHAILAETVESINGDPVFVLEIGSGWGKSAGAFTQDPRVHLVTIDRKHDLPEFTDRVGNQHPRIARITALSHKILPLFREEAFDLIFIDGDHGASGVRYDIFAAIRLIKPYGIVLIDEVDHPDYPWTRLICEELGSVELLGDHLARLYAR